MEEIKSSIEILLVIQQMKSLASLLILLPVEQEI